ncbi:glycoside hydrolase family 130 protein [Lutibacter sp.]|uniref:glycoside hydrolase family 130 protein n=1 Tax=Lutibacter sp. TaxID=1925666 RepID=UPI0025B7B9D5|nr:glycoside hydrolase family 130 protein [Lutibacter sp.]MCF6180879.1 glycoside hydrolase family 130 protein [Lutibacter sp.]
MSLTVKRNKFRFYPDPKRIITRFYRPSSDERVEMIIKNILNLSEEETYLVLDQTLKNFSKRHRNISKVLEKNYNEIKEIVKRLRVNHKTVSKKKKLLIGAYFTQEYSIESAAFFNPSIVLDPDQFNLEEGQNRVIISFRATGEGHISSIVFRSAIIDKDNNISVIEPGYLVDVPETIKRYVYDKKRFKHKFEEIEHDGAILNKILDRLNDKFIYGELMGSIVEVLKDGKLSEFDKGEINRIKWFATSHYETTYSLDTALSERVIFPVSYSETNGIEDARFVKFTNDDGKITYYATYTAYNGRAILSTLLETKDFYNFKIEPLNGKYAINKGLALFPRKINGKYAMISRYDGYANYIMFSDNLNVWQTAKKIQEPTFPWEFTKIGNAGSPLETEKGWLLITHSVGPMRRYSLGAILLDLEDPSKVIARLEEPLLMPNEDERDGYVPNIVYSCGSIILNNELIIPYAISDYASTFATISMDELFDEMVFE